MQVELPFSVVYNKVKPLGFPTDSKVFKFVPTGNIQTPVTSQNNFIRFQINNPEGFWDPYSTYINLTVDVSANAGIAYDIAQNQAGGTPIGYVLQVDGSAQSFINKLLITAKGMQLECIYEYDSLAVMLADMNYNPLDRRTREQEGCGGMNVESLSTPFFMPGFSTATNTNATTSATTQFAHYNPLASMDQAAIQTYSVASGGTNVTNNYVINQSCATQLAWQDSNLCPQDPFNPTNLGGNFQAVPDNTGYPTNNTAPIAPVSNQTQFSFGQALGPGCHAPPYALGYGFAEPFTTNFSQSSMEIKFSGVNCQRAIVNGQMVATNNTTHQFSFPLISGLLGILVPPEQYKLIPFSALRDMIIEFTLNQFALFSSNPGCPRTYQVSKMELVTEVVLFGSETAQMIESQLDNEGIILQSQSFWMTTNTPQPPQTQPGQIMINQGFESLKSIYCLFYRYDYMGSVMARKHYRLSMNVASMQIQVGFQYFPPQPISGAASTNLGIVNNGEFYIHLLKAFNRLHKSDGRQVVGTGNFAINFSVWDFTLRVFQQNYTGPALSVAQQTLPIFQIPGNGGNLGNLSITPTDATYNNIGNFNTQNMTRDIAYYFENAIVGKAIFAIDLEGLNYGGGKFLGGINTINVIPWSLNFQYVAQGQIFPRNTQNIVFVLYDYMLKLNRNQILVLGAV